MRSLIFMLMLFPKNEHLWEYVSKETCVLTAGMSHYSHLSVTIELLDLKISLKL